MIDVTGLEVPIFLSSLRRQPAQYSQLCAIADGRVPSPLQLPVLTPAVAHGVTRSWMSSIAYSISGAFVVPREAEHRTWHLNNGREVNHVEATEFRASRSIKTAVGCRRRGGLAGWLGERTRGAVPPKTPSASFYCCQGSARSGAAAGRVGRKSRRLESREPSGRSLAGSSGTCGRLFQPGSGGDPVTRCWHEGGWRG